MARVQGIAVWVTAGLLACSGGGDKGPSTQPPPGPAPVATVAVSLANASLLVLQSTQATATTRDASGNTLSGRTVSWNSSAPGVATVSSSGVVTAVSAGTANIVATSEGQSGSAALTVTPDPASAVTLQLQTLSAGGQPIDPANVAGVLDLALDAAVPTGATGTLTVTVGGIEFHRSTVAPGTAGTSGLRSARASASGQRAAQVITINLADYTATLVGEAIRTTALRNGPHDLVVKLDATVGGLLITRQATQRLTVNQVDAFVGLFRFEGSSLTVGGKLWEKGELQLRPALVSYSGGALEEVRLGVGDAPAQPGGYATARVVREVTRTGATALDAIVRVPLSDLAGESPAGGSQVWLTSYRIGGVTIDPRTTVPNVNGTCAAVDRRGFATSSAPAAPPQGCSRFQLVPALTSKLGALAATHRPVTGTIFYDHQGPARSAPGLFALRSRVLAVGQPATDAAGTYGAANNWVGARHVLGDGLDFTRLADAGVGVDATTPPVIHAGPQTTESTIKVSANLVGPQTVLPATTGGTSLLALATVADRLGNTSDFWLETTAANPLTDALAVDPSPGDGTRAALRVAAAGGTATWTGVPDGAWTRSTNPGWALGATFSGAVAGYPANFASLLATHVAPNGTATRLVGSGGSTAIPTVIGGTGGATGTVTYPFSQLVSAAPGNKEGFYRFRLCGADNAGLAATFPTARVFPRYATAAPGDECNAEQLVAVDLTAPTTSGGTLPAEPLGGATPQTHGAQLHDNMAVAQGVVGAEYRSFGHSGFDAGYVYAPIVWQLYSQALLQATLTQTAVAPWVMWLLSSSGAWSPGTPAYLMSHLYYQSYDRAGNASARSAVAVPAGQVPAIPSNPFPGLLSMSAAVGAADVCIALSVLACSGNPVVSTYALTALSNLQQQLFEYVIVYAILSNRTVRPLCRATVATILLVGLVYEQVYQCSFNWLAYPLSGPGPILIAMMGVTRQGYGGKHGRFLNQVLH